ALLGEPVRDQELRQEVERDAHRRDQADHYRRRPERRQEGREDEAAVEEGVAGGDEDAVHDAEQEVAVPALPVHVPPMLPPAAERLTSTGRGSARRAAWPACRRRGSRRPRDPSPAPG